MKRSQYMNAEEIKVCRGDIDYQGIVRHINDGVVIIREGNIVFANQAFFDITQKKSEQVINSEFSSHISPCDRERVTKYCRDRLFSDNLPDTIELLMPRTDGEAVIEMKVSVVQCGGSRSILGALTDITERRKTRLDLQKIKDRLESILLSMHEVVVSLSVADHSITSINPAAEALYGIPLRDFTSGKIHILDFVHPDDVEKVNEFYRNMPETEFDELQYRIFSNDKQVKWVLDEGHVVFSHKGLIRRVDHVIRDITEEKKIGDDLRASEAKYRDFFQSTGDMAFTLTPEGRFLDINNAGLRLLGFDSKEEALSCNIENFYVDVSERESIIAEIYGKGHVTGRNTRLKNKAGEEIEVAVTARAKVDESGRLLYHEGILHNITQAMETQRNRVLRNAAGSMCHYLNTHLMLLLNSKESVLDLMTLLDKLIGGLANGEDSKETAARMALIMEDMRHYLGSVSSAYNRIAEVTKALNKAFLYREEEYVSRTILDIFHTYGYDNENSA